MLSQASGRESLVERLNDLSGTEWVRSTRSVFVDGVETPHRSLIWDDTLFASQAVMSTATARPGDKKQHPATFPESDAKRLVRMFTRKGGQVLDPFMGTGSTAVACIEEQRACVGFELYERWATLARLRVAEIQEGGSPVDIQTMDALDGVKQLPSESQDFILTSPPYWGILHKKDHKAQRERQNLGLDTDYGNAEGDLSKIASYACYLDTLRSHFNQWHRVLRPRAYTAVVVSDFRHGSQYYPFHAHVGEQLERAGFTLQGLVVIVQDSKRLYPYGYPSSYVPNICNQFVVIGRKL